MIVYIIGSTSTSMNTAWSFAFVAVSAKDEY